MLVKVIFLSPIHATYLAKIDVFHLAQRALQSSTAGCIKTEAKTVHSLHKQSKTARVGRILAAKECLLRHSTGQLASHEEVGLAAQLFDKFMGRIRIEDIVLNGNILIIELLEKTQARDVSSTVAEPSIPELIRDGLYRS